MANCPTLLLSSMAYVVGMACPTCMTLQLSRLIANNHFLISHSACSDLAIVTIYLLTTKFSSNFLSLASIIILTHTDTKKNNGPSTQSCGLWDTTKNFDSLRKTFIKLHCLIMIIIISILSQHTIFIPYSFVTVFSLLASCRPFCELATTALLSIYHADYLFSYSKYLSNICVRLLYHI